MWWENSFVLGVAGAAAFIVGITTIWGKGIVPAVRGVKRFFKAVTKLAAIVDVLFEIGDQFKPNGGESLHDRMNQLRAGQVASERRQTEIAADIAEVKADVAGVKVDVSEVKRQVETIITEELPIITALAEHVVKEGEK